MTTIIKQPGSPFYYARFKINGKDTWISTKTKDPREAKRIANIKKKLARGQSTVDEHFSELQQLLSAMPPDRQDAKRQELSRRLLQNQAASLPISTAWQSWLDSPVKGNPAERTISGYTAIWKRFIGWLTQYKLKYLHEITGLHAQDYSTDLWKSEVSPSTYNAHVKFLRAMFNALKLKAGLILNPWAEIKTLEKETQGRENFTPEELSIVCSKATGAFRFMIALGIYTGMRLGDVVTLRWADIGRDVIEIIPLKTRRKGKKVSMPIHPVLRALLKELKAQSAGSGYLFPAERETYLKDSAGTTKRFQQFLNDCGIKTTEKSENGHRRRAIVRKGFHSLRHSFVSLCAANRVPQVAIQTLVGHGSPAMTELYSHADFEQKQNAIKSLPAIAFENNNQKERIKHAK